MPSAWHVPRFPPVKTSVVSVDGSFTRPPPRCKFQHRYPKDGHIYKGVTFKKKQKEIGYPAVMFRGYTTQ